MVAGVKVITSANPPPQHATSGNLTDKNNLRILCLDSETALYYIVRRGMFVTVNIWEQCQSSSVCVNDVWCVRAAGYCVALKVEAGLQTSMRGIRDVSVSNNLRLQNSIPT